MLPPVIVEFAVVGLNVGNGLLFKPKFPLTLPTNGI
jgi:hypothetical protein